MCLPEVAKLRFFTRKNHEQHRAFLFQHSFQIRYFLGNQSMSILHCLFDLPPPLANEMRRADDENPCES
jgi:hypothetical protein